MKILVNGIGITDSGGVSVLEKLLEECTNPDEKNEFIILLSKSNFIDSLIDKYANNKNLTFRKLEFKNYFHRVYYENTTFRKLIARYEIDLVYNFTSTTQLFINCRQLLKIHNLLYYSKKLDKSYIRNLNILLWLKQVFFKRIVFKFMLNNSKYIEIQSSHVLTYLSDYIDIKNKHIYIKSDIEIEDQSFYKPKHYNFNKKIKFLYIVGPHFDYTHKNFKDFINAMIELDKLRVDFEINITLTKEQLLKSKIWNNTLDSKTNYFGYIEDSNKMHSLFSDNTILVSTSIIETLGLHVIEAIKNGILTITPNEDYAREVYGPNRYGYDLFDISSFCKTFRNIITDDNEIIEKKILFQQKYLRENEMTKFNKIDDVFKEVFNV